MTPENGAIYTIQSPGICRVTRSHLHDWLVLLVLIGLEVVLELVIHPFNRFVSKEMLVDLKYPLKPNTVPMWTVPLFAGVLPIIIFLIFYICRRNVYDLHNAVLGLLYAMLSTAVITSAVKDAVGRPRPDFFWRCFPDGLEKYDSLGNVVCHGTKSVVVEGYKSFPSGHSSMSFAGLGFLSLYLAAKIKAFDHRGHVAKLCVVFIPLLAATFVAISRVDDYWHHWTDVFAGGLLGMIVALFCYHQFFPPPYDIQGWQPYASLLAMGELHRDSEGERVDNSNAEVQNDDHLNVGGKVNIDSNKFRSKSIQKKKKLMESYTVFEG